VIGVILRTQAALLRQAQAGEKGKEEEEERLSADDEWILYECAGPKWWHTTVRTHKTCARTRSSEG
jgi:hypothetical protein